MELKDINNTQNNLSISKADFFKSLTTGSAFADLLKSASSQKAADFSSRVRENRENPIQDVKNGSAKDDKIAADKKEKSAEAKPENDEEHGYDKKVASDEKRDDRGNVKNTKEKASKDVSGNNSGGDENVYEDVEAKEETVVAFVYGAQSPADLPVSDEVALMDGVMAAEAKEDALLFPAGNIPGVDADVEALDLAGESPVSKYTAAVNAGVVKNDAVKTAEALSDDAEMPVSEEFDILVSGEEKTKEAAVNAAGAEKGKILESGEVAEQASKLAEVVGADKKLKVSVDVKEEKFAYKDAVANKMDLFEATDNVIEAVSADNAEVSPKAETSKVVSEISRVNADAGDDTAAGRPVVSSAPVQSIVMEEAGVKVSSSAAKEDLCVSSVSTAQAYKSSGLRTDAAAANDDKATFKDVYKGLGKEAVEQVKVNITKSAVKGVDKIEIQLKPEDLGSVEVKLKIGKDGKLDAQIMSSRPETLEALQKDVASLEKAFNEAGFKTDDGSLNFSLKNGQEQDGREQLKNFIGDALEKDVETAAQEYYWSNSSGVNIRV